MSPKRHKIYRKRCCSKKLASRESISRTVKKLNLAAPFFPPFVLQNSFLAPSSRVCCRSGAQAVSHFMQLVKQPYGRTVLAAPTLARYCGHNISLPQGQIVQIELVFALSGPESQIEDEDDEGVKQNIPVTHRSYTPSPESQTQLKEHGAQPGPRSVSQLQSVMESLLDNPMKAVLYLKELTTIVQNQQSLIQTQRQRIDELERKQLQLVPTSPQSPKTSQISPDSAEEDKRSPCCKSLVPQAPTTLCRSVGLARKAENQTVLHQFCCPAPEAPEGETSTACVPSALDRQSFTKNYSIHCGRGTSIAIKAFFPKMACLFVSAGLFCRTVRAQQKTEDKQTCTGGKSSWPLQCWTCKWSEAARPKQKSTHSHFKHLRVDVDLNQPRRETIASLKSATSYFTIGYKKKEAKVEEMKDYNLHLAEHMTGKYKKKDNTFGSLPDPLWESVCHQFYFYLYCKKKNLSLIINANEVSINEPQVVKMTLTPRANDGVSASD
ncbi:hypothetical protein JOB18_036140 [Solea senegalensis]|uniref:Uncharacterized protein n=1 Tax=Solea senegalensis TaxID=28829 RepID=A0AAV6QWC7_SOLSE|nr:hypothetical protein JOB18_036140 [Solea senegalensis]